jgi:hypothetical protein
MEKEMSLTDENVWTKDSHTSIYSKSVPLKSPLGEHVLSDLAILYPHFKPKYIYQYHEYDGAPFDMVTATVIGPEDVNIDILKNGVPNPQERYNDIACISYILTGDVLTFGKMDTFYDIATWQEPQIRPDLREFYEIYEQLKQTAPDAVAMIEHFATIYEKQIAGYNGTYEPLALRELLWNFAKVLVGS